MNHVYARERVTEDNFSPVLVILTWILLCTSILSVTVKLWLKVGTSKRLNKDDGVLIAALIFSIAQSAATSVQGLKGLGHRLGSLSLQDIESVEKSTYASEILFVFTLAVSKFAILILIFEITPVQSHQRTIAGLAAFIAVWSFICVFVVSFQCDAPKTWEVVTGKCIDEISFWTFQGVTNMLTDVALIVLSTYILSGVQIGLRQKASLMACFAARITYVRSSITSECGLTTMSVVAATITQLVYLHRLKSTQDIIFDACKTQLCMQFVQNLSIITVCIPHVKNLLLGLESGMFQTGDFQIRRRSRPSSEFTGGSFSRSLRLMQLKVSRPTTGGSKPPHRSQYDLESDGESQRDLKLESEPGVIGGSSVAESQSSQARIIDSLVQDK
ncbi:MAG: hypothetical protein Q9160_004992 [Pyrenula sp. 1 TL-2023]